VCTSGSNLADLLTKNEGGGGLRQIDFSRSAELELFPVESRKFCQKLFDLFAV
jgi:hypothetical protein